MGQGLFFGSAVPRAGPFSPLLDRVTPTIDFGREGKVSRPVFRWRTSVPAVSVPACAADRSAQRLGKRCFRFARPSRSGRGPLRAFPLSNGFRPSVMANLSSRLLPPGREFNCPGKARGGKTGRSPSITSPTWEVKNIPESENFFGNFRKKTKKALRTGVRRADL